jgi:hypothetical protein
VPSCISRRCGRHSPPPSGPPSRPANFRTRTASDPPQLTHSAEAIVTSRSCLTTVLLSARALRIACRRTAHLGSRGHAAPVGHPRRLGDFDGHRRVAAHVSSHACSWVSCERRVLSNCEKRLLERAVGNGSLSGTHERAPDGFLIAYGAAVRSGRLPRGSILDVAPTLLYFLGLPVGLDMDGYARPDVFSQSFTTERPITFILSYDR